MKIKYGFIYGLILFGAATFLAGCAGFWDLPASTTTTTTTATTLSSGVFYVLNQTTKQIAAYSISSGTLEQVSGSPYDLSSAPSCIAIAPGGGFLYVGTVSGIYLYTIGSSGALTIGNGGAVISSDIPAAIEVSGSWLIDTFNPNTTGSVQLDAIPINASTGLFSGTGSPPYQVFNVAGAAVEQMALSPDGTNLFVALGAGGTIVVPFTTGNSNPLGSSATVIPVVSSSGSALSVAVDPTNRLFYIGETLATSGTSGGLRVFNYSSLGTGTTRSAPTQITGSPIASGGLAPNAILPISSGEYVYVANGQGNTGSGNITWFPISVSGTTYTIAAGSSIAAGVVPKGLAEDSDNNFVLAVSNGGSTSSGDPDLEAFTMSSGALTSNIASASGTDPVGAVAVAALP
jgi:6-phosphogluconolactonase